MKRANGEGTIFKRKNSNIWVAQDHVTLVNGEQKRLSGSGKTRAIAIMRLREKIKLTKCQMHSSGNDWTVAGYLNYWMREIQANRIRETTMTTYNVIIKKHIIPTMGYHKVRNLSVYNIREALAMMGDRGCSNRVKLECIRVLSACLNSAMREEIIHRNVAQLVEKPKYVPKEIIIWSLEQIRLFLDLYKDHPQYIALFLLLVNGMRRGELLGLRWSDIDFDNSVIHIRQQIDRINGKVKARDLKTMNSRRNVPLKSFICAALMEHAKKNNILIPPFNPNLELSLIDTVVMSKVGTPLEPRSLNRLFNTLV